MVGALPAVRLVIFTAELLSVGVEEAPEELPHPATAAATASGARSATATRRMGNPWSRRWSVRTAYRLNLWVNAGRKMDRAGRGRLARTRQRDGGRAILRGSRR